MIRHIPYSKHEIQQDDIEAVVACLKSDFLTQGPMIDRFEKSFADFVEAPFAVACSNGTAALHISMLALNLRPNQKILTTPMTFAATANSALYCGAQVEFIDIDPTTYQMDLNLTQEAISRNSNSIAGIVTVDYAGRPIDSEAFRQLCSENDLWLLDDACHAVGAKIQTQSGWKQVGSGSDADLTVFSFHPAKHLACGEGGMVTTQNEKLYHRLRLFRSHGITKDSSQFENKAPEAWYHEMQELGFNYRITDFQAALGLSQLNKLNGRLARLQQIASNYLSELRDLPIELPHTASRFVHAWHLFVIQTERRDELYRYLREHGIYTQVHYIPVYRHPYYQRRGFQASNYPNTEKFFSRCLSLPCYASLSDEEQAYVIDKLKSFFR